MNLGRNDRCPCGSGFKHKSCCLKKFDGIEMNVQGIEERNLFKRNILKLEIMEVLYTLVPKVIPQEAVSYVVPNFFNSIQDTAIIITLDDFPAGSSTSMTRDEVDILFTKDLPCSLYIVSNYEEAYDVADDIQLQSAISKNPNLIKVALGGILNNNPR